MNETIQTLLDHRSIRKFKHRKLTDEQIKLIVESAQAASTSSFVQGYSIIGVTDKHLKEQLAELAGNQSYVADNGHLFIFCADMHRHEMVTKAHRVDATESLESTEKFMVAVIDASLAAQNAATAAESMGLGICYIGGIRNDLDRVGQILNLPDKVLPLFGLVVGYPDENPDKKPRLPFDHVYHENGYEQDEEKLQDQLQSYDEMISNYYSERTGGKRTHGWTSYVADMLSIPKRTYMREFLQKIGFPLK